MLTRTVLLHEFAGENPTREFCDHSEEEWMWEPSRALGQPRTWDS